MADTYKPVSNHQRVYDKDGNGITSHTVGDDQALDTFVVGGDITIDNAEINVEVDAQDGDNVAIHSSSTGDELIIHPNGSTDVNVIDSVLPDGAATETTATLIADSLDIIDDWDESDRAKVNPIVGQAGVAAGTGVDSATTQRVSLATNVPLPAGSNSIGTVDTELPAPVLLDGSAFANPTVPFVGAFNVVRDTSGAPAWTAMRGTGGSVFVNGSQPDGTSLDATNQRPVLTGGYNRDDGLVYFHEVDDTGRQNVNPIVGQSGVAANSGAIGDTVQRVMGAYEISTGNCSTTPLFADQSFTGTWQDMTGYETVISTVYADQAGSGLLNGLLIQWSDDGTNIRQQISQAFVSSFTNRPQSLVLPKLWRYFRVSYSNGSIAQGAFSLQTTMYADKVGGDDTRFRMTSELTQGHKWMPTMPAFIGTTPEALASVFAPLRLNASYQLVTTISDTLSGSTVFNLLSSSDGQANTSLAGILSRLEFFNGTTWDRARGDTTNGLDVDVTRVTGTVTTAPSAVTLTATTVSTDTEVSVTGSSTQLLAANSSRKRVFIQNHGTGFVRVRLAASALTTSPIRLVPEVGTYEILPSDGYIYRGVINAISEAGTNLVGVIEET